MLNVVVPPGVLGEPGNSPVGRKLRLISAAQNGVTVSGLDCLNLKEGCPLVDGGGFVIKIYVIIVYSIYILGIFTTLQECTKNTPQNAPPQG
jgi:hypothetical protein